MQKPSRRPWDRLKALGSRLVIGGSALDSDSWADRTELACANFFDLTAAKANVRRRESRTANSWLIP